MPNWNHIIPELSIFLFLILLPISSYSQGGIWNELENLDKNPKTEKQKVYETFFGTRVINGHSIETPLKKTLQFIIAHRFGRLNSGFYQLFGIDQASVRFGLEYGILDRLCAGFGRSTFRGTWDGFIKCRILEQSSGKHAMPFSLTSLIGMAIDGRRKLFTDGRAEYFSNRLSYYYQILAARKFTRWFSVQIMPSLVHQNIVKTSEDKNLLFIMGGATRFRITSSVALMAEYHHRVADNPDAPWTNPLALGVEINTGGHVFQIHLTNAQAMFESGFLRLTSGRIRSGDIHLGFNITRNFGFFSRKSSKRRI